VENYIALYFLAGNGFWPVKAAPSLLGF